MARPSTRIHATRIVLLHRRTSAVLEVQRELEARGISVFPVVTPDELLTACSKVSPHMAVVRCSNVDNGLDVVRWLHGQMPTARLPVALLGPFDEVTSPTGHAGLLGCLDERLALEHIAEILAELVPAQPLRSPKSSGSHPSERPESMLARLAGEGKQGLLVVSEDDGSTTVVSIGPEVRRLGAEKPAADPDERLETSASTRVEFIETGERQRLGLVDLNKAVMEGGASAPLPPDVRALVVENDEESAQAIEAALTDLGIETMRLAPTPGWLEHAVDYWPDVLVSDAQPRGPRGFEFLREQAGDPVLSWIPTLLVAAPTSADGGDRAMAMSVLAAEVHQALGPRIELEQLLDREGPQKGAIERFGVPRLLRSACERRRDAVVGEVDEWNTFVFTISGGKLVSARQQGAQGGRSAGPGALARALLTRSGNFTIGPLDASIEPNLSGALDTQLSGARAMIRSLSSERGQGPGRALGCDEGMLHKRLEDSEPRRRSLIEALIMGSDARRAAQQVGFRPDEARELLEELFRFGAIGIVRHLEGDARPSSDESVSSLSSFAAGVPEELRPLFEFEETEVSSYADGFELDYSFVPEGTFDAEEVSVSLAGVDLSIDDSSDGAVHDESSLPALDVGVAALEEETLPAEEEMPGDLYPDDTVGPMAGLSPAPVQSPFDDSSETQSTAPRARPSRASAPVVAVQQGPGAEEETPETRVSRPSGQAPSVPEITPEPQSPAAMMAELETMPSAQEAAAEAARLAAAPSRRRPANAISTEKLRAVGPGGRKKPNIRLIIMGVALALAVAGGVITGLAVISWRETGRDGGATRPADVGGTASIVAPRPVDGAVANPPPPPPPPVDTVQDGGAAEAATDGAPPLDAGAVDAAPLSDGGSASDADGGGASSALAALDAAVTGGGSAGSDAAVASSEADGGVEALIAGLPLRRFGAAIRVPRSDRLRRRMNRRELRHGARSAKRRDYERAAWHYQRALKLVPGSPSGLVGLGENLASLGRHEDARVVLVAAIDITAGHYMLVRAGYACLSAGDTACARRAFEKSLSRRRSVAARRGLATVRAAERREE